MMNAKVFRVLSAFICIATAAGATSRAGDWDVPRDPSKFHIFLLMGQSNMAGSAPMVAGDNQPVPKVLSVPNTIRNDFKWQPAAHPLEPNVGFGLGLSFAAAYLAQHRGVTVGLLNVAVGGQDIDHLKKGTAPYLDGITKAQWAATQGVITGVLWHQGESDTVAESLTSSYADKLDQLVRDVRADLGSPRLPFVCGELADFYGTNPDHAAPDRVARIGRIQQILRDLPKRVPQTACASSKGLRSMDGNNVHFDRASYIEYGIRYAAALASIQKAAAKKPPAAKPPARKTPGKPAAGGQAPSGQAADEAEPATVE